MNKVSLTLQSTEILDETAVLDVYFNDQKVVNNFKVLSTGSNLIFNVDEFTENNNIKIEFLNYSYYNQDDVIIKNKNESTRTVTRSVDNFENIQEIVLFLGSVKISKDDGQTWEDVTPGSEKNPQEICFQDDNFFYGRLTSLSDMTTTTPPDNNMELSKIFLVMSNPLNIWFSVNSQNVYIADTVVDSTKLTLTTRKHSLPSVYLYKAPKSYMDNYAESNLLEEFSPPFEIYHKNN